MSTTLPVHMIAACSDELQKIATEQDRLRRFGKNLLAVSLGTGAGYGSGWLAKQLLIERLARSPNKFKYLNWVPRATAALGGALGLVTMMRLQRTKELEDAAGARRPRAKIPLRKQAFSYHSPERGALIGGALGAAGGGAAAGIRSLLTGNKKWGLLTGLGALGGGTYGYLKSRAMRQAAGLQ